MDLTYMDLVKEENNKYFHLILIKSKFITHLDVLFSLASFPTVGTHPVSGFVKDKHVHFYSLKRKENVVIYEPESMMNMSEENLKISNLVRLL